MKREIQFDHFTQKITDSIKVNDSTLREMEETAAADPNGLSNIVNKLQESIIGRYTAKRMCKTIEALPVTEAVKCTLLIKTGLSDYKTDETIRAVYFLDYMLSLTKHAEVLRGGKASQVFEALMLEKLEKDPTNEVDLLYTLGTMIGFVDELKEIALNDDEEHY